MRLLLSDVHAHGGLMAMVVECRMVVCEIEALLIAVVSGESCFQRPTPLHIRCLFGLRQLCQRVCQPLNP
jgi:hypothetical protein